MNVKIVLRELVNEFIPWTKQKVTHYSSLVIQVQTIKNHIQIIAIMVDSVQNRNQLEGVLNEGEGNSQLGETKYIILLC